MFTNSGVAISAQNVTGLNQIDFPIQLGVTAQTFECTASGATFRFGFSAFPTINLNGQNLTVNATGTVETYYDITGTGNLIKNGSGRWLLVATVANTYVGTCNVNAGILELNDFNGGSVNMITGNLNINNSSIVEVTEGDQIADTATVTMNGAGQFNLLFGSSETISNLTMAASSVDSGTGTLNLNGDIKVTATAGTPSISGNLHFNGALHTVTVPNNAVLYDLVIAADVSDTGSGFKIVSGATDGAFVRLTGSNSFTGPLTIDGLTVDVESPWALGTTAGTTTVTNSPGELFMFSTAITNESLTLASGTTFTAQNPCSWNGPVVLNGNASLNGFNLGGSLTINGRISGTGNLTKIGPGSATFAGSPGNIYNGVTTVNEGILLLAKSSIPAIPNGRSLIIGDGVDGVDADIVRYGAAGSQIIVGSLITINDTGLLDLNNFTDDVGDITMNGGHIKTGTGTLTLSGNVTVNSNTAAMSVIDGAMDLSAPRIFDVTGHFFSPDIQINAAVRGSALTKNGVGELGLTASNSYAGLTTVNGGLLVVDHSFALGTTAGGTVVNSGAVLTLRFGVAVGAEPLTIAGTGQSSFGALNSSFAANSWAGDIALSADATISVQAGVSLNLSGAISGGFNLTKSATGTLQFSGATANTYTGTTTVNAGTLELNKPIGDGAIPGALVIGDGSGGANADVVRLLSDQQIASTSDVTINSSGRLDFGAFNDIFDALSGNGHISFGASGYVSFGFNNGSSTWGGVASGTGFPGGYTMRKTGTGTITFTGNNTYLNQTRVDAGTLLINGSQPQSPLLVTSSGTAGGSGTVGDISCSANLAPGNSPGCLTSSNLFFTSAADFFVELTGTTPCSGHDQLIVHGTNNLGNAVLHVVNNFPPGKPSIGDQFTILNNDAAEAITGTFSGLANNATFNVGDIGYRINYNGGTGNDVVLTVLNAPGASVTINATDRGWYDDTGSHSPGNANYVVGQQFADHWHNWFVFNIPQFAGTIVQAELLIKTYDYNSTNASEKYVLRHVSTPIATLVAGGAGLTAIYDDLADGPVYSVRNLLAVEEQQRAIIPLNLTFINDATAAAGGQIALGGSLPSLVPGSDRFCFGASGSASSDVQLRLTFGTSTTINASDRGQYNQTGAHTGTNQNYLVGENGPNIFHNFFLFGLPSWSGNLVAAELSLNSYTNASPTGFLSYQLHDVSTPIATLTNTAVGATATYADLANGGDYGGRDIFVAERGTRISVPLGNGFIGAATANEGGEIALGGSIANLDPIAGNGVLFSFSNLNLPADTQLWLGFMAINVPSSAFEPGTPLALGGNGYQFTLTGTAGTTNEIQMTTDFVNWDVVRTLYMTNSNTTFNYTNSIPNRFFRARLVQ